MKSIGIPMKSVVTQSWLAAHCRAALDQRPDFPQQALEDTLTRIGQPCDGNASLAELQAQGLTELQTAGALLLLAATRRGLLISELAAEIVTAAFAADKKPTVSEAGHG